MPNSLQFWVRASIWARAISSLIFIRSTVGTLWSMVAHGEIGAAHLAMGQPQAFKGHGDSSLRGSGADRCREGTFPSERVETM